MLDILIIGHPYSAQNIRSHISNLVRVIAVNSNRVILIGGVDVELENVCNISSKIQQKKNIISRVFQFIAVQLYISKSMIKQKYDIALIIPQFMIIPIIVSKILRKPIGVYMGGRGSKSLQYSENRVILFIIRKLEDLVFYMADYLVAESQCTVRFLDIEQHQQKIFICPQWVDTFMFGDTNPFNNRECVIGYIGALSNEKGGCAFIKAMSMILRDARVKDIKFLIIGDGDCKKDLNIMKNCGLITDNNLYYSDWVPKERIPQILSSIKLLVIPSISEGLPNILLEAMACGTPVLATPVGAIPDIIQDGYNGFLMDNNSPECIVKNIYRSLKSIDSVAQKVRDTIEKDYSFEKCQKRWQILLENFE